MILNTLVYLALAIATTVGAPQQTGGSSHAVSDSTGRDGPSFTALVTAWLWEGQDVSDLLPALLETDASFPIGKYEYLRCSRYGIELVYETGVDKEAGKKLVTIQPIPPKVPSTLPQAVQRDMQRLQGVWRETQDGATEPEGLPQLGLSGWQIEGNRLVICSGAALGLCYRLGPDHRPNVMHFYWPEGKLPKGLPRRAHYELTETTLTIRFSKTDSAKKAPADRGQQSVIRLRRVEPADHGAP